MYIGENVEFWPKARIKHDFLLINEARAPVKILGNRSY